MRPDVLQPVPRTLVNHYLSLVLLDLPPHLRLPQWYTTVTTLVPPQTRPPCVLAPKPWMVPQVA